MGRTPSVGLRALAAIAAIGFAAGAVGDATGVLDGLERETVTTRFDIRGAERPNDVVVVGIDAKTFDDLGVQWPFPRSLHGRVIRRLHAAGAREIVYDVQFTEATKPREDLALFRAIGAAGGVLLATSESDGHGHTNVLGGDENLREVSSRAAASDLSDDGGGAVSRFPRAVNGLETLAVATAERAGAPNLHADRFADGGALIDYRGPGGTIPSVSFSDVLEGRFSADLVRGRVVVVGASAPTLRDVHATPVDGGQPMAGAEVQANAIWTALHGLPLRIAPSALGLVLLALLALVPPLVGRRLPGAVAVVVVLAGAGLLAVAQLAFEAGTVINVAAPLVTLLVSAVAFIAWSQLTERRTRLLVQRDNELLEARVRERTEELRLTQLEIVRRLGAAVEWRDADTGEHVDRIGRFAEALALAVGMPVAEAELLRHASVLHDVGKVGIPDHILNKPGPLGAEEWEVMKTHTTIGASILEGSQSELMRLARTVALTHHENWNGTGYPAGLQGEDIPLAGRICTICDVFDALLSPRPYKSPWPLDEVIAEIASLRGTKFDPSLVDAFLPLARAMHTRDFPHERNRVPTSAADLSRSPYEALDAARR
jgi:response regulator RpfG family c-di-GMP phosphodiesterase